MSDEQQGQAPEAADTTQQHAPTGQQDTTKQETQAVPERVEDLPEWAQKLIKDTRKESGDHRVKAKEYESKLTAAEQARQDQLDAIAQALGLKDADKPPSVDDLTEQLTAAQQQAQERESALRQLTVERAAERAAREHGADVDTLLDSRTFASKLADLDPAADDFAATVSDLVKQTVDSNPKYRVAPAATSSSADFSSGPGEKRTSRPTGLYDAVSRTIGPGR
ncbi:hypothetical protein ACOQFV_09025 [Nocardiopsis changdeensis]|uniref:Scaffolding protein n=1 Tax=Nocardiopsis changdeensis TaxID=2831969 RepID=A0ABX8BH90_9ACTN|nr:MULTISPECIES: hypothetical protein [Nocardiopsis]QUX20316.1 hypothetical protein KGD84_17455 [Nocardiopsis changdeensis]QYX36246.1 hypothetical protein K1J57_26910 [Nocardiopsis sp. MT53]